MLDWVRDNEQVVLWLGVFSVACFVASLVLMPILIVRMPSDYFAHRRRMQEDGPRHPVARIAVLTGKNVVGLVLIAAGIAMLVLPGQGILTILIGLFVMDFPGKYALEKRLARQKGVLRALNWIRLKAGRPPLRVVDPDHG